MNGQDSKAEIFDVFLCHNSEDKPAVREIAQQLREKDIKPWLDEEQIRPGTSWQTALERQIENIKSAAVFVGADLAYAPSMGGSYRSAKLCRFPASGSGSPTIAMAIATEVNSGSIPTVISVSTSYAFSDNDYVEVLAGRTRRLAQCVGSFRLQPNLLHDANCLTSAGVPVTERK